MRLRQRELPTYSEVGLPSGVSINSSTGLISGTPAANSHDDSPYNVTVTAADGTFSGADRSCSVGLAADRAAKPGARHANRRHRFLAANANDLASGRR